MIEVVDDILRMMGDFIWSVPMAILLLGTHLWMTIRTGGIQRKMLFAVKLSVSSDKSTSGEISNFGALMVALAATMGTGNIIGVGTAVAMGGPGAIFWCFLTGLFGIATKYAESLLAVKYRIKNEKGKMIGGAMVVLDKILHKRGLAVFFCIATICAAFGIGNLNQANSVAILVENNTGVSPYITGFIMAFIVGAVMVGGIKWLSKVCEWLVPFMAGFYMLGCIYLLCVNGTYIVPAIKLIITSAFAPEAVEGGLIGGGFMLAMRYGLARGLFSNEAGLGSSSIVSASAKTDNAVRQALISSTAVFWDTMVVCTLTGLVIVTSVIAYPDIDFEHGAVLTTMAFGKIHSWGSHFLTVAIITFVFSTILGWSFYAERCMEYLGGTKLIKWFQLAWIAAVMIGSIMGLNTVWLLSDVANALMAIPNLVCVLALSGVVAAETKKYCSKTHINDIDPDMER